ncbi:MAG: reductase, partial [Gluconacetobacter diazotrophicus]|nr:reductase [Gluconacetobacter diazotrophicus]
ANPRTGYDVRGLSHARLAREGAKTWPLAPDADAAEGKRRYVAVDGALRFPTESGRARFWARPYLPNVEMPDDEYPFVLLTGRVAHQWHTRTKTGKVPGLNKLNPAPYLEIHPEDAAVLGAGEGDAVRIVSRRGELRLPAHLSPGMQPGCCWAPMHWNDLFAPDVAVNEVTSERACPESHQPELKYCAVRVEACRPAARHDALAAGV